MIKDKLTQIANEADNFADLHRDIKHALNDLRCDKCRFWQPRSTGAVPEFSIGYCTPLENLTLPDFFCALWKSK